MSNSSRRRRQLQLRENNIRSFLTPSTCKGTQAETPSSCRGTRTDTPSSCKGTRTEEENENIGKGLSLRKNGNKSAFVRTEGEKDIAEFFDDKENVSPNIGPTSSQNTSLKPSSDTKIRNYDTQIRPSTDDVTKSSQSDSGVRKLSDDITADKEQSTKMTQDDIIAFLTQEDPGERYYQILANERRRALAETLAQNEELTAENSDLREKNAMLQAQLDSALELVGLYQKLLDGDSPHPHEGTEDKSAIPHDTKDSENTSTK